MPYLPKTFLARPGCEELMKMIPSISVPGRYFRYFCNAKKQKPKTKPSAL
jgi:hypothetical protein